MLGSTRTSLQTLAVVAVVAVVTACGSSAGSASTATSTAPSTATSTAPSTAAASAGPVASAARAVKVIYSSSAVDANIAHVVQGMKDAIPQLNQKYGVDLSLDVLDAGMSSDKQISDLQTAIVKKPDVMMVDPVNVGPLVSVVQQAKAAGIKVWGGRPSPDDPAGLWDGQTQESVLETQMAANMKAWIQSQLDANASLVVKVGICYGAAAQTEQLIRGDVIKTMAKDQPTRVQVVAEKFCDWDLQKAQDATSNFITAHPDMNLVVAANNQMAQGSVNAVTSAGKSASIQVASYDIDQPTAQLIADGKLGFTTGFEMYGFGIGELSGAVELALGTYKPGSLSVQVFTVTKDNATQVKGQLHN